MQISLNIDADNILKGIPTTDLISHIELRPDKFEILEAFSNTEIINYIIDNKVFDEEIISFMIDAGRLNLESILGKVANLKFQKGLLDALKTIESQKTKTTN